MPIHCPIKLPRITDEDMRTLDYKVMEHAFASHNELGRLADENVYQQNLLHRLHAVGIRASIEVPINLSFQGFSVPLAMDLVVDEQVIYELKCVSAIQSAHESQLLGYMFLMNATHGKLINFRPRSVESRFVNTTFTADERRLFKVDITEYSGHSELPTLVRGLVAECRSWSRQSHHDQKRQKHLTTERFYALNFSVEKSFCRKHSHPSSVM